MPFKRDISYADDGDIEPEPKRAKTKASKTRQHQNSGIDPTWGQKYVFSDFDDATTIPKGEEDDFEDDSDAMAYLMSVRQQASSIPHLLVAPKVQIGPQLPVGFRTEQESDEEGEIEEESEYAPSETDSRGFYEDGAYIGAPADWAEEDEHHEAAHIDDDDQEYAEKALREAYLASVLNRYQRLRSILRSNPPSGATSRLSGNHPTDAPHFGRYSPTNKIWSNVVRNADPHPLQIALLSKDSVIRILRVILGGKFLRQGYSIPERTSCWLWALLARLPDQGELNHTEIGWIRDLGRRAVLLGRSLAEMAALREEVAEGEYGVHDDLDASSAEEIVAEIDEDEDDDDDGADVEEPSNEMGQPRGEEGEGEAEAEAEEGEVEKNDSSSDTGGDVAMDLSSDTEVDEGEVIETANDQDHDHDDKTALEEAKRALLAKLSEAEDHHRQEAAKQRARMNMRATLCMIITVAGEFYGQRDLLEFFEPFVGM